MRSILVRILAVMLAFALVQTIIIVWFSHLRYGDALIGKTLEENRKRLEQLAVNVETLVDTAIAATNLLSMDSDVLALLSRENPGEFYAWYRQKALPLRDKLVAIQCAALYRYESELYLFDMEGACYATTEVRMQDGYDLQNQAWYRQTLEKDGFMVLETPASQVGFLAQESKNSIVITRTIRTPYALRTVGVLAATLRFSDALNKAFTGHEAGEALLILNRDGDIAAGEAPALPEGDWQTLLLGAPPSGSMQVAAADGTDLLVNYHTIYKTGWRVVQAISRDTVLAELGELSATIMRVSALLLVVVMALLALIALRITTPLRNLSRLLSEVGRGNFALKAPVKGRDEIAQISGSFNYMVSEIDFLIQRVHGEHKLHEKTMLDSLRAQINPHFILNTLNNIKWMAHINGDTETSNMLVLLGHILEKSLGRGDELITLSEELQFTRDYVRLQAMRFGDGFSLDIEAEESLMEARVPALILQPLVENSIFHGLADLDYAGEIRVKARREEDCLVLEVEDNGAGMDESRLQEIVTAMRDIYAESKRNIGVANVHRRIVLRYGEPYGLRLLAKEGGGAIARLTMPLSGEERRESPC